MYTFFLLSDSQALVIDPTVDSNELTFLLHLFNDLRHFKADHTFGILCENGKYRIFFF